MDEIDEDDVAPAPKPVLSREQARRELLRCASISALVVAVLIGVFATDLVRLGFYGALSVLDVIPWYVSFGVLGAAVAFLSCAESKGIEQHYPIVASGYVWLAIVLLFVAVVFAKLYWVSTPTSEASFRQAYLQAKDIHGEVMLRGEAGDQLSELQVALASRQGFEAERGKWSDGMRVGACRWFVAQGPAKRWQVTIDGVSPDKATCSYFRANRLIIREWR